jgi:SOS-response transcriptional repressor LexA
MDFFDRIKAEIKSQNTSQEWVAKKTGIPLGTLKRWLNTPTWPQADQALAIAKALNTSLDFLMTGERSKEGHQPTKSSATFISEDKPNRHYGDNGEMISIPILNQRVAAGTGQEVLHSTDVVGTLPFLKRMLRGAKAHEARALEVRGDSMTGVQMFDGDLVVFVPGLIRGDGIYVLRVGDSLLVKRVEFDEISKKLRIMSENPRYPDRVESADGQIVTVEGKVLGWVHAHPY